MSELATRLIQIYDEYRSALLNQKYYAHRLQRYRRLDLLAEISVAIGTSSTVASWAIWKTSFGTNGWTVLAGAAVVVSMLKPILQLGKSIEKYGKLFAGYSSVAAGFRFLISEIRITRVVDESTLKAVKDLYGQVGELTREDDPLPAHRLLEKLQHEVNLEVPPASLWMPSQNEHAHG